MSKAALSTDGRYFNQAAKQLDSNWMLLKRGFENMPTWQEWYAQRNTVCHVGVCIKKNLIGPRNKPRVVRSLASIHHSSQPVSSLSSPHLEKYFLSKNITNPIQPMRAAFRKRSKKAAAPCKACRRI